MISFLKAHSQSLLPFLMYAKDSDSYIPCEHEHLNQPSSLSLHYS